MGERGETYNVIHADHDWWYGMHHRQEDAAMFSSAINSATECEDMGYDGEACVKALPELVELTALSAPKYGVPDWEREAALEKIAELLARCRG